MLEQLLLPIGAVRLSLEPHLTRRYKAQDANFVELVLTSVPPVH